MQKTGWQAFLNLEFEKRNDKTILTKRQHQGPLTIQKPLYPTEDDCHCYLLHPPGGVVGGDELSITSVMNEGTDALITTPGATKFYRSENKLASQTQQFKLYGSSLLTWMPQENIFFPGATVNMTTRIELSETANFVGWEINCFGQPANNILFSHGEVHTQLSLFRNRMPCLIERQSISQHTLNQRTGLRNYPVNGLFIFSPATEKMLDYSRKIVAEAYILTGITLVDEILLIRVLAHYSDPVKHYFSAIWQALHPYLYGKEAILPRIWAT